MKIAFPMLTDAIDELAITPLANAKGITTDIKVHAAPEFH